MKKGSKISPTRKEEMSIVTKTLWKDPLFRNKLVLAHTGSKQSVETIKKRVGHFINELHWQWKGDNANYRSIHSWIVRKKGKPMKCEHCNLGNLTGRKIHWANVDHKYRRNLEDYLRLCALCHKRFDRVGLSEIRAL